MKQLSFVVCLVLLTIACFGQDVNRKYKFTGIVRDSASLKPVDPVTLVLLDSSNTRIGQYIGDQNGNFIISSSIKLPGKLLVTALGYKSTSIKIDSFIDSVDFGVITIARQDLLLKEVVVTTNKLAVKQEIDRIVYDLNLDEDSKTSNTLEIVRKIPLLSLDANENVLLKGSSNFRVLLNGRPSSILDRNSKEFLRGMAAANVDKIEVITDPPAKYEGEGLGGIINIITKRRIAPGYNGTLSVRESFPGASPVGLLSSYNIG